MNICGIEIKGSEAIIAVAALILLDHLVARWGMSYQSVNSSAP